MVTRREIIFSESFPIDAGPDNDGLALIRRGFSDLFDRAAQAVQRAGHDLDDVVVERFLTCRLPNGSEVGIAADALSDEQRLADHVRRFLNAQGIPPTAERTVRIVALKAVAILESTE